MGTQLSSCSLLMHGESTLAEELLPQLDPIRCIVRVGYRRYEGSAEAIGWPVSPQLILSPLTCRGLFATALRLTRGGR